MAWYFNFCSPAIPNDPVINMNRKYQTACLIIFMVIYIIAHIYYKFFGPELLEEKEVKSQSNGSDGSSERGSDQTSEHNDDKSISIAGGFAGQDQNSSYVTFNTKEDTKRLKKNKKGKKKKQYEIVQNVTVEELQAYFPIVYGNFAIAVAFCIMYSPYTEQTIAAILYILLSIMVTIANGKRKMRAMKVIWGIMCFIVFFLVMSSLLEVGQANFNKIEKQCFAVGYKPLY